ncbi:hypothetical protein [Runella limosa]|uniref:hypothetical protein n=1 Tax=Runella limosa TaxID=370978 RepID=UPI00048D0C5C|nr:hypothetical protein [Runella limosa]
MNTIAILIGKKKHSYEGPSSYDECTSRQFVQLVRLRQKAQTNAAVIFMLFRVVYGLKERISQTFFSLNKMRHLNILEEEEQDQVTEQGVALLQTCNWVFEGQAPSKWLIRYLSSLPIRFEGPDDKLSNLTFEQFWYSELYYTQSNLAKMMAVLYCKRPIYGKKKEFDSDKIDQNSKHFRQFEKFSELKDAIFFNYEGCRQWLATCFPHVFKSGESKSEKQGNWLDVAIGMAGDDPLKFNALKKENIYIVLKMLDNSLAQIEKLKEHNGANS